MKDEVLRILDGVLTKCKKDATSITIPSTVKKIKKKAFIGCKNLKEIIYDDFVPADVIQCTRRRISVLYQWYCR